MRQMRRDRERMRQRQEAIERGSVVCRARTIEEVLAAADASESEDEGTGGRPGSTCEECTDRARREVAEASSFLPFFRVCDHQYRRRKRRRTQRRGWRREERRRAREEVQVGAEAEVRRERKGAGWAEEGRRGVGGLVERGSGAVWRYAGCLCGLSRGLIRYDSPSGLVSLQAQAQAGRGP